ncbi:hypothetical protein GLYMA_16G072500v4 [Glycine max]|uniref:Uncharacterized protein n=1 Tax=Glycine max TaxID=3847 RepID=A0A0R0FMJ0_SOYBN|nr:hypothetical protein GYH30_044395 [Glycine max]KRH07181.1 hypothetical protein GLYMA_16G072500v4 [Glycine max]
MNDAGIVFAKVGMKNIADQGLICHKKLQFPVIFLIIKLHVASIHSCWRSHNSF